MTFTLIQKKEAYKKLSPEIQDFIVDNETTELISKYFSDSGLNKDQSNLADSEILYSMLGIQSLSDAISNIAKLSNKNINDFSKLKTNLDNDIFSKIKSLSTPKYNKNKVIEIAQKYSLDQSQTDKFLSIVSPNISVDIILSSLGVSRILAEQIKEDLKTRVFDNETNVSDKKIPLETPKISESPIVTAPPAQNQIKKVEEKIEPTIPEIRPQNMPMVEKNEPVRIVPPQPRPAPQPMQPQAKFTTPIQAPKTEIPKPPLQPTVKYVPPNIPTTQPRPTLPPQNIIDNKLNNVVKGTSEQVNTPKPPEDKSSLKYTIDPYREPLE